MRRTFFTVLLLVAAVLLLPNDDSLSTALSPTTKQGIIRQFSVSSPCQQPKQQQHRAHNSHSLLSLSISTTNHEQHPAASVSASDDRRNQSLEQGHHPLWSLNLNLDSMAQAGAGNRAQELLKRIHALYEEGYYEVSPDIVSYNSVLKAWKEEEQPEAALELLETMIRNEKEGEQRELLGSEGSTLPSDAVGDKPIRVDVISFNTVIAAFANQGNYQKALELLRKMQKEPSNNNTDDDGDNGMEETETKDDYYYPNPDTITYNIVLYSLALSDDPGTAAQAENLLREMMMRKERTGLSVVDTTSFNTVLYAWSREGESKRFPAATTTTTTNKGTLPKRPLSPKMSAQRAEDLLTIMKELSEAGNMNVRPDVYSYTTVIQSWAKCGNAGGTDKAQAILDQMIDTGLQPNQLTYTALMNALSRAGEPERAESVLHQMMAAQHKPDTVAVSSIIDGWAKVSSKDRPEAAKRALQIFRTMKQKTSLGVRPTATTYTSVLTALAKSCTRHSGDEALDLLQEMEEAHAATGDDDNIETNSSIKNLDPKLDKWSMRPKNIHYNCVLDAYARSSRADKAIKAQHLMTVMENHSRLDCRPDTISYNSLMMACAHATGDQQLREKSFEIALRTFKILLSNGGSTGSRRQQEKPLLRHKPVHELHATSTTFAHFFRACRKLLRPDNARRKSILTKSLTICRKLGLLNFLVVHQVQLACQSETDWKETAGGLSEYVGWKEDAKRCIKIFPREWTCNARR